MTQQIPGEISFDPTLIDGSAGYFVQWNAANGMRGDQLAIIVPADSAGHPGRWRVLAQSWGTGYTIALPGVHATVRAAQQWCLTYQDWPLLRQHIL